MDQEKIGFYEVENLRRVRDAEELEMISKELASLPMNTGVKILNKILLAKQIQWHIKRIICHN